jgi:folate-dependent phosphoribosylglycinamide formyltransferase PurN
MSTACDLGRPIRVVMFGGTYLQPGAVEFAAMLEQHPDVDLLLVLNQGEGTGVRHRFIDVWRRRRWVAFPLMSLELATFVLRLMREPSAVLDLRRQARVVRAKVVTVGNLHSRDVLDRLNALQPDLGVIYGSPILRRELFQIPSFGTLGIHHGRVPDYRGKKTTFWEMYNGEDVAGVTIQRINPGVDTGDVAKAGVVEIGRKSYLRVEREVEQLGFALYLDAILDVRRGTASYRPQSSQSMPARIYRQPAPADIARFWYRRILRRLNIMGST